MLHSAALAKPPLEWPDLGFIFVGSALSMPLILGLQAVAGRNESLRLFCSLFALVAVYLLAGGLSAVALSFFRHQISPASFMFLLAGLGLFTGVVGVKLIFHRRFERVL